MTCEFCLVYKFTSLCRNKHLLRVHLMLCKVLNLNLMEVSKTTMQSDICRIDTDNLHSLHHLTREVETSCWRRYSTFILSEYTLEILVILFCCHAVSFAISPLVL